MIYYLTFNDPPSGIFSSQVVDVVNFLRQELKSEMRLVSFISLRKFKVNRRKIKDECSDAIVIPMIPGLRRWKLNRYLLRVLCYTGKPDAIIARSVLATHLAFESGIKEIIYDGRGAISAEWHEYNVVTDAGMLSKIQHLEKIAILNATFRIAVSSQLVKYWQHAYDYADNRNVIIPCTLNKAFEKIEITEVHISAQREKLNFSSGDIVFVYSGSVAGWQSFSLLDSFIKPHLQKSKNIKLLFLSDMDDNIKNLMKEFPSQVSRYKVDPREVPKYLMAGDYGILIREQSITNQVASPVKFAEYLACGLKVIISENLGDYSTFISDNECGHVYTQFHIPSPVTFPEKQKNRLLALKKFTKKSLVSEYERLLTSIAPD